VEEGWVGLVHTKEYTHTRGLRKATHRSGGVGYICMFDKVDMICEPFCHKSMLFRCFPYALVLGLGFSISDPFSSLSREGFFFF